SSSDELIDVKKGEISILKSEEANNVITKLMQTVPEMNKHININDDSMSNTFGSDSDFKIFRSDSEVKTVKSHNIISLEYLNNTIKQLEKKKSRHSHERIEASIIVAEAARKGVYHARCIHAWAINYIKNSEFSISRQGKHPKTWSFLWDDDVLIQIKSFLQSNKWNVNLDELAKH
ncbi:7372_t:CDS:2, partial [Dentiscutata heterogama]